VSHPRLELRFCLTPSTVPDQAVLVELEMIGLLIDDAGARKKKAEFQRQWKRIKLEMQLMSSGEGVS
jgi:hypothetical protein